jgi:anti-sigma regulatory factor (Ser/Thr protein kinase)
MSFHFEALDLKNLDVVPTLSGMIERIAATKEHAGQVFLILSELVSNALDHGLLRLDSTLKTTSDGFAAYAAQRQNALKDLQEGFIDIGIEILRRDKRKMAKISVRDSGPGFNWAAQSQIPDSGLHGRGIELVRRLSHDMQYTGTGSEVVVYYELSSFNRAVDNCAIHDSVRHLLMQ